MAAEPRFAIYFVPAADSALYRFGAAVLGYDCYTGAPVARLGEAGLSEAEWAALTAEPRTYGFHATLKAPFRLRDEFDQDALLAQLETLAASITTIPTLRARRRIDRRVRGDPAADRIACASISWRRTASGVSSVSACR